MLDVEFNIYWLFNILMVIVVWRFQFVTMEKLMSEFVLSFPLYKISIKVRKFNNDQE